MKRAFAGVFLFLVISLVWMNGATAQSGSVQGVVLKAPHQQPIPGLKVSLIHPVLGRSAASFTDALGRYSILGLPLRPEPYYLEVYWGASLVFRAPVQVNGPVVFPPITL